LPCVSHSVENQKEESLGRKRGRSFVLSNEYSSYSDRKYDDSANLSNNNNKRYTTLGLKPEILKRLEQATDKVFPGMFLPSALIIMMNEVKLGLYRVEMNQDIEPDFTGRYHSLTLRFDVSSWLRENYENLKADYLLKYNADGFTQFASIFMLNMFESKARARSYPIRLKEQDYLWLVEQYFKVNNEEIIRERHCEEFTFDQFASVFFRQLLERVKSASKTLA
jgi:hypothetical protein